MKRDINREAEKLTKALSDSGKIIEAGFVGLRMTAMAADAPALQVSEMRIAFFAGAQHLFGSIMAMLDPENEPTDRDLRRMDLIDKELKEFITEFTRRYLTTQGSAQK